MIFGLLICLAFAGGTFYGYWICAHQGQHVTVASDDRSDDMARQWHNLMVYNGTEQGQLGDDDDA